DLVGRRGIHHRIATGKGRMALLEGIGCCRVIMRMCQMYMLHSDCATSSDSWQEPHSSAPGGMTPSEGSVVYLFLVFGEAGTATHLTRRGVRKQTGARENT
ncbi:MAG TPA: hypothetical protein VE843_11725, partial [Ktedonobacteraceae bacterium]|nr:hypothetical protein [Ktedonobacteraceae bacterium]